MTQTSAGPRVTDDDQDVALPTLRTGASADLDARVRFQANRTVLPASNRVVWRMSLLVLVLGKFRGQTASVGSLHLISWALRGSRTSNMLRSWLTGETVADLVTSRMDPLLETTLRLASAEGLVTMTTNGRVALTERGKELAAVLDGDGDVLASEKSLLRDIAPLNDSSLAKRMGGVTNDI